MASRYLILSADALRSTGFSLGQVEARTGLKAVHLGTLGVVLVSGETDTWFTESKTGVAIGRLFSQADFRRVAPDRLLPHRAHAHESIASLIENFWGGYIYYQEDADGRATIFRDPSAAMPCYYVADGNKLAFASDIAALTALGLLDIALDWPAIGELLRFPNHRSHSTAIDGLNELFAGFAFSWTTGGEDLTCHWSPWDHVAGDPSLSFESHSDALRTTVEGCIQAWGNCFDRSLVGLSGGLDSSIITVGLAARGLSPTCLTLATHDPDGDERDYARALCQMLDLSIHERWFATDDVDLARCSAPHLPRPIGEPFLQSHDAIARRIAQEFGIPAMFRGNGGDAIFCFMQSATPVVDRFLACGLKPGLWQTVRDASRITDASVPEITAAAIRGRPGQRTSAALKRVDRFLAPAELADPSPHPWLRGWHDALPGRSTHVEWVLRVQRFAEGFARDDALELICPLQSQPIVEACLAIPSWHWIHGGINRAVVRRAFANALPAKLLRRNSKGGPAAFCIEILETFRAELREYLLDGLLVANGILDRTEVERYLSYEGPVRDNDYLRLLALADTEAWARHWAHRACVD
jgi:asparagine synthase (glutamine-hydrolysing)